MFKKILISLLILSTILPNAMASKIQQQAIVTHSDCVTRGISDANCIPTTDQVYDTTNSQLLTSSISSGALGGGGGGGVQLLTNGGFETGTAATGWTITTATGANELTTIYAGSHSEKLTYSSSVGDIAQSVTPAQNTASVNMEASCKVLSTMTTIQVCALSGGVETVCQNVPATGTWQYVPSNFIGPSNGTSVGVRVKTSSSGTGTVFVDDCYVGPARNLGQVSQAQFLGGVHYAATASCNWTGSSSTTFAAFSATAACSTAVGLGTGTAPGTKIPAVVFPSLPAGDYMIRVLGMLGKGSNSGSKAAWRVTDGTNNSSIVGYESSSGSSAYLHSVELHLSEPIAQSNVTLTLQSAGDGSATAGILAGTGAVDQADLDILVYRFPTSQDAAYLPSQTPASWSGYQTVASGWTTTGSTFADPSAGTSVVTTQTTSRNIVCSSSSTSSAISCNLPRAGIYNVQALVNVQDGVGADVSARLMDSSATIIDAGGSIVIGTGATGAAMRIPLSGQYSAPSAGTVIFKVQTAANGGGTVTISNGGATGTSAIQWSLIELDAPMAMPVIISGPRSQVTCAGAGGYGSTNTAIRILTTCNTVGSDIVYATSGTAGNSFTIQTTGVYSMTHCDGASGGGNYVGISLNSNQLTSGVSTITAANRLASALGAAGIGHCVATDWNLTAGDVIRAHDSPSGTPFTGSADVQFNIVKVSN